MIRINRTPFFIPALLALFLSIIFLITFIGLVASQGLVLRGSGGQYSPNQVCTKNHPGYNYCYDAGGSYEGAYPAKIVASTLAMLILTVLAIIAFIVTWTLNHKQLVRENKPLIVKETENVGMPKV